MNKEEFDKEFGNVEKTIKMPKPPTWEEVVNNKIEIININQIFIAIDFPFNEDCAIIVVFINRNNKTYLEMNIEFNEVNYYRALRKMKELWLEEVC